MLERKIYYIFFFEHLLLCFEAALDVIEIKLSNFLYPLFFFISHHLSLFIVLFLSVISRKTIPHVPKTPTA
jgi:hypothetical protein